MVLGYNGLDSPKPMQQDFVEFVRNCGGAMLIQAANNAFSGWKDFNDMIALGWRAGSIGKCLVINQSGEPEAEVFKKVPGFEAVPFANIGLYVNDLRKMLPEHPSGHTHSEGHRPQPSESHEHFEVNANTLRLLVLACCSSRRWS